VAGVKGQVQKRGEDRRRAILDAALEVFAAEGPSGGGLAEIGARAGTTRAGLLHHFGSKEELLLAVIKERDAAARHGFVELTRIGGVEMLRGLVAYALQAREEQALFALHTSLLALGLHNRAIGEYFAARAEGILDALAEGLARGQGRGEIRHDVDCRSVARQIVAFQEGAAILAQLIPGLSLVELYEEYLVSLIEAVGA
jgi:AcrR family transcriptional regulator